MKAFQKGISMALTLTLVATLSTASFAAVGEATTTTNATNNTPTTTIQAVPISAPAEVPVEMPTYLQGQAVVKAVFENGRLLVMVNDMEVALNTSEKTFVLDAKTGLPATLTNLKVGDLLYVYYSPAMTRSLPPQSFATAIITQVEKDKIHPSFFIVKEVVSRNEKEVRVLNEAGDLIATITKDMPLSPFKTKQIVALQDIQVGSQLFIWYDIVAMSYPGQTHAQKTIYIGQAENAEVTPDLGVKPVLVPKDSKFDEKISINGKVLALGKYKWQAQNGQVMVPLRVVAEALGFKVTWDGKTKSVSLDDGTVKTNITLGHDGYYKASSKAIGLTQMFEFGAKPVLIENSLYVPVALFNLLYSNNAVQLLK